LQGDCQPPSASPPVDAATGSERVVMLEVTLRRRQYLPGGAVGNDAVLAPIENGLAPGFEKCEAVSRNPASAPSPATVATNSFISPYPNCLERFARESRGVSNSAVLHAEALRGDPGRGGVAAVPGALHAEPRGRTARRSSACWALSSWSRTTSGPWATRERAASIAGGLPGWC